MRNLQQLLLLVGIVTFTSAKSLEPTKPAAGNGPECAKGMAFWCQSVINAKKCNAVDFCVKTVWETHRIKVDSNVICDDCKEWVAKARTFVENKDKSGEVVKSLKWTCDLIPLDYLAKSCEKVVDENVPEILRMLESKMDPDVVCSNLLICNNANYSKALLDQSSSSPKLLPFTCSQCQHVGALIESKFNQAQQDDVLEAILKMCGEMSSYSDSCSSIVLTNFDDIYKGLRTNLKSKTMCELSASCLNNNYQREGIIDIVPPRVETDPSIPCELCQQLALHLRELLITNTTDIEFKNIMIGFCHEMGQFSDECVSIADQYYKNVYNFLVDKLNANKMCKAIGICPTQLSVKELKMPTMPLVSSSIFPVPKEEASLPNQHQIELDGDKSANLYKNGSWCTTCNYLAHILQEVAGKQSTEDEIVHFMKNICDKLPKKIQSNCDAIVDLYGDTMMWFIGQQLDPKNVCSRVKLCAPSSNVQPHQKAAVNEKPTCQFCLFALQEVHDIIETNKTKQNIKSVVSGLCLHLSDNLVSECTEFINKYSDEVVEMFLADFSPQEACTFIKLCNDSKPQYTKAKIVLIEDVKKETVANPQCELCKEIIKIVEQRVINKNSKDEIRAQLEKSCSRLSKFSIKCTEFVDKYSDTIVDLIAKELGPEEICRQLIFCVGSDDFESQDYDSGLEILMMAENEPADEIKQQPQCVICEFVMTKIENELNDQKVDEDIKNIVRNICSTMPASISKSCKNFVDYYFNMIIVLIETMEPSEVCGEMKLCPSQSYGEIITRTKMVNSIKNDVYTCAVCKGVVEGIDAVIEDPYEDTNFENLEEKLCIKMAGKYRSKCHDIAKNYGLLIINLLKNLTDSDQICYKLELCALNEGGPTGMLQLI